MKPAIREPAAVAILALWVALKVAVILFFSPK